MATRKRSEVTSTEIPIPPPPPPKAYNGEVGFGSNAGHAGLPPGFDKGAELASELKKAEAPQPDPLGLNTPAGQAPNLPPDFERIIETQWVRDIWDEYHRLEQGIHIGAERTDYATVHAHLDHAESNSRKAFKLYLTGRIEKKRWETDADVIRSAMWAAATRELQREKEQGNRNKSITDADVKAMANSMYPDEWRSIERKDVEVHAMHDNLEDLAMQWKTRVKTLQTMMGAMRK